MNMNMMMWSSNCKSLQICAHRLRHVGMPLCKYGHRPTHTALAHFSGSARAYISSSLAQDATRCQLLQFFQLQYLYLSRILKFLPSAQPSHSSVLILTTPWSSVKICFIVATERMNCTISSCFVQFSVLPIALASFVGKHLKIYSVCKCCHQHFPQSLVQKCLIVEYWWPLSHPNTAHNVRFQ